ncbi:MAG: TIM barrel protein [Acidobacteria bacterium]|nr:TIM barrel protein [Acidobacteriota bacterium]
MKRREFLPILAAAGLSAAPAGRWKDDRLGVACNVAANEAKTRELLAAAAEAGFRRIQLFPPWKAVDAAYVSALPGWVKAAGLEAPVLGAYVNCCQPGNVIMETREQDFVRAIEAAATLGATCLTAWTGGYGAGLMSADPRNFTPAAQDNIRAFLDRHARRLDEARLHVALEQYSTLACPDAPSLGRLLGRVPDFAGAVLDPPNLTPPPEYANRDRLLDKMFRILAGRIAVVHLKDFTLAGDGRSFRLPGPMQGAMNYPLFIRWLATLPETVPLFAEHIRPAEFAATRSQLLPLFRAAF